MDRNEGPQRLRLFVACRLPQEIVERVVAWQRQTLEGATGVRPTPAESLHITMVFLGSQPGAAVDGIGETVRRRVGGPSSELSGVALPGMPASACWR